MTYHRKDFYSPQRRKNDAPEERVKPRDDLKEHRDGAEGGEAGQAGRGDCVQQSRQEPR